MKRRGVEARRDGRALARISTKVPDKKGRGRDRFGRRQKQRRISGDQVVSVGDDVDGGDDDEFEGFDD